ncbi:MAG: efflux RND transporter periplasmic adaptor subunit [Desulfobacterales bacterium]|nr:efflux RND transporter periplasmic adaptor subunit [Desulfobacterales bacterium]
MRAKFKTRTILIKLILPLAILAVGFVGMGAIVNSRTAPAKQAGPPLGPLVETLTVQAGDHQVQVHVTGTVQSRRRAEIMPQVSGRVTRLAPGFEAGGFFREGELLFEIEVDDYRLAVEKTKAEVVRSEYELAKIESEARVARVEWERLDLDNKDRPNPLVLYEPQLANARAALAAAKADLTQRRLDVRRTKVRAPFNGRIQEESIDPGQYVVAGQSVAVVAGTDTAEIVVPVPLNELRWLEVPRRPGDKGSSARVHLDVGGHPVSWEGRIDRGLGDVDPKGRMARLVVAVEDPYGLSRDDDRRMFMDLSEGLFVQVILNGRRMEDIVAIPAEALRSDATVWIMAPDNKLAIRTVSVLRRERDTVLVRGGLATGDQLIITRLSGAAPGMALRLAGEKRS